MNTNQEPHGDQHQKTVKIPRNVNLYRHLIDGFASTDDEIEWVLKLRTTSNELTEKLARIPNATFGVFDKKLEGSQAPKEPTDLGWHGNSGAVNHLINHRIGPTAHGSLVAFETNLRKPDNKYKEKERGWSNVPFKDRHEYPSYLPPLKEELRMTMEAKSKGEKPKIQRKTALEGHLDYPSYTFKVNTKNVNDMRHLHYSGNFQSAIDFDTGLRYYEKEEAKYRNKMKSQGSTSKRETDKKSKESKDKQNLGTKSG
eukprot:TRINITY_DN7190_c0_g1_i4.p1 TRINITY_DN7190_c0_g1~~TRINITY_DN7190_c0_g1_i4.p1  ORF type:complete len:256 (-),score=51.66 TRINITY_DN7190_c0_g1_i4:188-955(-)